MSTVSTACTTVAKGGVGESGASSFVIHTVSGPAPKMMVLRTTDSSLCPNTGAVAMLSINGVPTASGSIAAVGSSIQTEAAAGAHVAAVVHTVPLFNGIVCVRLGELNFKLDECELVTSVKLAMGTPRVLPSGPIETRDWYAWNNLMPPRPDDFHVIGEVQVPNPGVDVVLTPKHPQGFNPRILLLDLLLIQAPGQWPQMLTWKQARYDKVIVTYDAVEVFYGNQSVASIPVDNVH